MKIRVTPPIKQKDIIISRKGNKYILTTMDGTVVNAPMILAGFINRDINSLRSMLENKGWVFEEEGTN